MTIDRIITQIDAEIGRLKEVRALLATNCSKGASKPARKRSRLSAAARKKIADAQRKRWAKQKAAKKQKATN